jgi:hypothetical protein
LTGNARTRRPSINRVSLRCTPHGLPAAYRRTPRSPLVLRLDPHDFSRPAPDWIPIENQTRTSREVISASDSHSFYYTHAELPSTIAPSRKKKRRFRCSPRPILHTTLDPNCQINSTIRTKNERDDRRRATCERFRRQIPKNPTLTR